jgi:hypothetical protein
MSELMTRDEWKALNGTLPTAVVLAFGKSHKLRRWTVQERDRFDLETLTLRKEGKDTGPLTRARIVAHSVVDADGRQLFLTRTPAGRDVIDPAAVETIASRDAREFARLWKAAADLQGFGEDDEADGDEGDEGNS